MFEWLGWYLAGVPKFMTSQEFRDAGLPVCLTYTPIWPLSRYNVQETTEQFYDRCYQVTREILKKHESQGMLLYSICMVMFYYQTFVLTGRLVYTAWSVLKVVKLETCNRPGKFLRQTGVLVNS